MILAGNSAVSQRQKSSPSKKLRENNDVKTMMLNEIKVPKLFLFSNGTTCLPHTIACSNKEQLEFTLEKRGELFQ